MQLNFFTRLFKKKITTLSALKEKYPKKDIDRIIKKLLESSMINCLVKFFKETNISASKLSSLSWRDFRLFYPTEIFNADLKAALQVDDVIRFDEHEIESIFRDNRDYVNSIINDLYFKFIKHDYTFATIDELTKLDDKIGDTAHAQNFKINSSTRDYAIAFIDNKLFVGKPGEHHADLAKKYLNERHILLTKFNGSIIHDPDQFDLKFAIDNNNSAIDESTENDVDLSNVSYMFGHVCGLIGFIDDISSDLTFDNIAKLVKSQLNLDKVYRHSYNSNDYTRLAKAHERLIKFS